MKKLIIIVAILITGFVYSSKSEAKTLNNPGFEFGFFYSNLAPYGTWIELDGLVVWRPTVIRRGWTPYRHGRWLWTAEGWYWDSYEPFGYIVFHYGRWYYDNYYGWIWVPDYDWAPAWVEWRYDDDYIGWAPLPPYALFSINVGIHYTHKYYVPYHHWYFVRYRYFCDPYVYNYYVAPNYKYRVYNRTKYRNNYAYRDGRIINNGVDVNYVRNRSGREIRQRDIQRVNDYREVEKYRGKDTEVIRTFVASRDELTRTRVKGDPNIEKRTRKTTLDVSKVRLGHNEIKERSIDVRNKKEPIIKRDVELKKKNNREIKSKNDYQIKRNETSKTERKKNYENVPEKKVESNDVQKREIKSERTNTNRKIKIQKETTNKNRTVSKKQRKENKTQKRTDVNDSKRDQSRIHVERNDNSDSKNKKVR